MTESNQSMPVEHTFFLDEYSARFQYEEALEVIYDQDCRLRQFCYYLCDGQNKIEVSTDTPYLVGISQDQLTAFFKTYLAYPLPTKIKTAQTNDPAYQQALEDAKSALMAAFNDLEDLRKPLLNDALFTQPVMAEWMAKQQIKLYIFNRREPAIQLCYAIGEANGEEDFPKNLIFLPESDLIAPILENKRPPQKLITSPFDSEELKQEGEKFVEFIRQRYLDTVEQRYHQATEEMLLWRPDFTQKPWRVLIFANYFTTVMRYAAEHMAQAFQKIGLEVKFVMNDAYSVLTSLQMMEAYNQFKPHIMFNINHLNNELLNEAVVNIVWWQDMMPILQNDEPILIRERDLFYALGAHILEALQQKLGEEVYHQRVAYQNQCVSEEVFYQDPTVPKRKAIVFVGSAYIEERRKFITKFGEPTYQKTYKQMVQILQDPNCNKTQTIYQLAGAYQGEEQELFRRLWVYVCRTEIIKTVIQHSPYPVELYGPGWEEDPETAPYSKGTIQHGQPLADLYRSVTYGLSIQPYLLGHQRLPEIKFCGAIPIVFWVPNGYEPVDYEDEVVPFLTLDSLKEVIKSLPEQLPDQKIRQSFTYQVFAEKVVTRIERLVGEKHEL